MDQPNNQLPGSSWPPSPDPDASARLVVKAGYPPFAFMYGMFTPTITINGQKEKRPWGTYTFDVAPGYYEISVSYPWLFMSECGKNTARLTLQAGETRMVTYTASIIRYLPGSISVS